MPWDDEHENGWLVDTFIHSGGETGFGLVPFWRNNSMNGAASFSSVEADNSELLHGIEMRTARMKKEKVLHRELFTGNKKILCWEYRAPGVGIFGDDDWKVECVALAKTNGRTFHAWYLGSKKALPPFYEVIRSVRSLE
jgi:hypothetical protein